MVIFLLLVSILADSTFSRRLTTLLQPSLAACGTSVRSKSLGHSMVFPEDVRSLKLVQGLFNFQMYRRFSKPLWTSHYSAFLLRFFGYSAVCSTCYPSGGHNIKVFDKLPLISREMLLALGEFEWGQIKMCLSSSIYQGTTRQFKWLFFFFFFSWMRLWKKILLCLLTSVLRKQAIIFEDYHCAKEWDMRLG